ncbi:MAG: radical SAM protein [Candidatus Latescibacterota bacterium]
MVGRPSEEHVPRYIELYQIGELDKRIQKALNGLKSCRACPWQCDVDRMAGDKKICKTGRFARVSNYFSHFGEENCLRGWKGSGTIFFAGCNLLCVFCQNHDISQIETGQEATPQELAGMMIELQRAGCHNINLVTPEHIVPQILEALPFAIRDGLKLPLVYNTGGFDSLESIQMLDGIVDVYMPDFKYWYTDKAKRYLRAENYPEVTRRALTEMHRQVGVLSFHDDGIARQGVLVRHLIMPQGLDDTREIMKFLSAHLSPDTYVNIMAQYRPACRVGSQIYREINRGVTVEEMKGAYHFATEAGLHRFDVR